MKSRLLGTLGIFAVTVAFAADKKLECPAAIFVTPKEDVTTGAPEMPEGWSPRAVSLRRELAGATLYDGRPEEKVSLVPDKQSSGSVKSVWNLLKDSKNGYWLECRYNLSPTVISKKVPVEAEKCVWSESKKEQIVFCD